MSATPPPATVTWLGHATVLIETARGRFVTDPVLRDRVMHLRRHAPPPQPVGAVDAVLLSHLHHDHLDVPSLLRVGAPVIGPHGTRRALRREGFEVREVRAGDVVDVAGARVRAVRAVHDGRRLPRGPRTDDDAIGFVIEADGARVYFAGDTAVFDGMRDLGPLDLALLPIWGWGTSLGPGHMNPREAADAVALLQPRVVVPIHWGTFLPLGRHRTHHHVLRDPAERFREHAAAAAPGVRVVVLEPNGSIDVDRHHPRARVRWPTGTVASPVPGDAAARRPWQRRGGLMVLRVAIADDNVLIREALTSVIDAASDVEVAAVCADADALLAAVDKGGVDVVVTDIRMPPTMEGEGVRVAERLRETHPALGVVLLSAYCEPEYAVALLKHGSDGRAYLLKDRLQSGDQLRATIVEVAHGGSVIDPKVVETLVHGDAADRTRPALASLTRRERQILGEMARGASNQAIAETLGLTKRAVEKHVNAIFSKLDLPPATDVSRRVRAVLVYLVDAAPKLEAG